MIAQADQAELIRDIGAAEGFAYEEFTSAAGIKGNLKVCLPEALERDNSLMQRFAGYMATELSGVDVIAATGGAVSLARQISNETGQPIVQIRPYLNNPGYFYPEETTGRSLLRKQPRVGFVEDVTSTRDTVERAIIGVKITSLVDVVVTAWRRGETAPEGMTKAEIIEHNRRYNFRNLYEVPSEFPLEAVIERRIPLWVPLKAQLATYLPELEEAL